MGLTRQWTNSFPIRDEEGIRSLASSLSAGRYRDFPQACRHSLRQRIFKASFVSLRGGFAVLTRLTISNFRCFRELDVPLKPLTVLIGPNDTGKSTFLDAIAKLAKSGKGIRSDVFGLGDPRQTESCIMGYGKNGEESIASFVLNPSLKWDVGKALSLNVFKFHLPARGIAMECEGYSPNERTRLGLEQDGGRVAALLDHILRIDLERFVRIRDAMRAMVPGFCDLKIITPTPATRKIVFVIEDGFGMPAEFASAGIRLLLFFIALVYHPNPPDIILLEEPETGLHPKRLADVVKLLRNITQGMHGGHAAQVILTTHSPYLLDCVDPEQDQVLVFQRLSDGSRTAMPIDAARIKEHFDGFLLGEVWFNEEEAGLIARGAE